MNKRARSAWSVSYTHLDVYKRQDFNREGLDDYLRLYEQLNPHIEIVKEVTPFEDYLKKIQIAEVSGLSLIHI